MDITAFLLDIEPRRAMASQATIPGQTNRCRCRASVATVVAVDDIAALTARNEHFIEACRRGSWEQLRQILGRDFRYLDGRTGQVWDPNRYAADLLHNPAPPGHRRGRDPRRREHRDRIGRTRSDTRPHRHNRYLDTYERRDGHWLCAHACVWPLPEHSGATVTP
jgi:hypothetical protein